MTKQEYAEYENAVSEFMNSEGLANLTTVSNENGVTEPYFSWRACECCKTTLGGDRYTCNGFNPTTKEIQEYEFICEDCVYYSEYGRLDDQTMMEIEG